MYILPYAGILNQELLEKRLNEKGYKKITLTTGLWTHNWRPISFTLYVDDFRVKYVRKEHVDHLLKKLYKDYTVSTDWEVTRKSGMDLY